MTRAWWRRQLAWVLVLFVVLNAVLVLSLLYNNAVSPDTISGLPVSAVKGTVKRKESSTHEIVQRLRQQLGKIKAHRLEKEDQGGAQAASPVQQPAFQAASTWLFQTSASTDQIAQRLRGQLAQTRDPTRDLVWQTAVPAYGKPPAAAARKISCLHSNRQCLCHPVAHWRSRSALPVKVIGVYFIGWELTDDRVNEVNLPHKAGTFDVIRAQFKEILESPLVGCCDGAKLPYALRVVVVVSQSGLTRLKPLIPPELLDRVELVTYEKSNVPYSSNPDWNAEFDHGVFEGVALNELRNRCVREEEDGRQRTVAFYFHAKRSCPGTGWREYLEHYILRDPEPCIRSLLQGNDTCGVDYWPNSFGIGPHYSGNFWWSHCGYVSNLPPVEPKCRMCAEAWIASGVSGRPDTKATVIHDSGHFLTKHGHNGSGFYALVDIQVRYFLKDYAKVFLKEQAGRKFLDTVCGIAQPIAFSLDGPIRKAHAIGPRGFPRCEFEEGQKFGKAELINRRCGCQRHLPGCQKSFKWDRAKEAEGGLVGGQWRKELSPPQTGCNVVKTRAACCNAIDSRYATDGFLGADGKKRKYFGGSACLPSKPGSYFDGQGADGIVCEPKLMLQRQNKLNEAASCRALSDEVKMHEAQIPEATSWVRKVSYAHSTATADAVEHELASLGGKIDPPLQGCQRPEDYASLYDHISVWTGARQGKPRIMCSIYTLARGQKRLGYQAAQWHTWGQTCDQFIYWVESPLPTEYNLPYRVLKHGSAESYSNMWPKVCQVLPLGIKCACLQVRAIWRQIHELFIDDFDYFTIGGDDTFLIVVSDLSPDSCNLIAAQYWQENLRKYLLLDEIKSRQDSGEPLYIGRPMHFVLHNVTANVGGATYVLNRAAVKSLMRFLTDPRCNPDESVPYEDVKVGCILGLAGVKPLSTVAPDGHRFSPLAPHSTFVYKIGLWGEKGW